LRNEERIQRLLRSTGAGSSGKPWAPEVLWSHLYHGRVERVELGGDKWSQYAQCYYV
jgi:hypothetical protein